MNISRYGRLSAEDAVHLFPVEVLFVRRRRAPKVHGWLLIDAEGKAYARRLMDAGIAVDDTRTDR